MICPNCRKPLTVEHLRESEACSAVAGKIGGIYMLSRRKVLITHAGGRPGIPTACTKCHAEQPSAREAREHCRKEPK